MFPGLDDLLKKAGTAEKRSVDQHKEMLKLLEEIRDAVRDLAKAMKGE